MKKSAGTVVVPRQRSQARVQAVYAVPAASSIPRPYLWSCRQAPHSALPPQVLLNSHSPTLVAALHRQPGSLVFADLVRRADGLHATRMRHIHREGDPNDRGATTVDMREVERILDTARPAGEVA